MADTYYPIPSKPSYNEQIRELKNSDPANATTVFNPLIGKMIENTHYVKKLADTNSEHIDIVAGKAEELFVKDKQRTNILYGTCSTPSSVADKVVNLKSGFSDFGTGSIIYVQFDNANYLRTVTLNVGNSGTKTVINLYHDGHSSVPYWPDDAIVEFICYGSYWYMRSFNEGMYPCIKVLGVEGESVTVTNGEDTFTQEVSRLGDVEFHVHSFGKWTITSDSHGGYSKTINIDTVKLYETRLLPLNACAWSLIDEYSKSGKAAEMWSIGDELDITVGDETLTVVIVDFNHDEKLDGTKAGITFGLKNLMAETRRMEATDTNANGFAGSELCSWLQGELYSSLPAALRMVIKTVNKKTAVSGLNTSINTESIKLFLFSDSEVYGLSSGVKSAVGEGYQYSYFATAGNRKKRLSNGEGAFNPWWLRSPRVNLDHGFCAVNSINGQSTSNSSQIYSGVCFGFCV